MSQTIYENEPKDYLTEEEQKQFSKLITKINNGRNGENKSTTFTNSKEQDEEVSQHEMANMLDDYISSNGIGISSEKRLEILNYLDRFRSDPDYLYDEIVCEVRTANGD